MNRQILLVGATLLVLAGCESWNSWSGGGGRASRPELSYGPIEPAVSNTGGGNTSTGGNQGTGDQSNLRAMDSDFLREAIVGNRTEIELGRVAVKQGQSDKVRDFGQHMIDDHVKMLEGTRSLARSKGMDVDDQLSFSGQNEVNRLNAMNGADFDRAYMRAMVLDHERDADAYDRASRTAEDSSVRSLAARDVSTIREHLRMARDIDQNLTAPMIGQPQYNQPHQMTPAPSNPSNSSNPTNVPENPR
jgi:putative membrane protein